MNLTQYKFYSVIFTIVVITLISAGNSAALTPTIDTITPNSAPNTSPTNVTITGSDFEQDANVSLLPGAPYSIGSVDKLTEVHDVYVSGSYAYVAGGELGLQVIDISTPSGPVTVSTIDTPGFTNAVYVSGNYAYLADGGAGLQVIDISIPSNPKIIGSVYTPEYAGDVYVSGSYAYLGGMGLQVIDISNPSSPEIIGSVATLGGSTFYISGNYAYLIGPLFIVIDITTPSSPEMIGSISFELVGYALDVYVSGSYAYVATDNTGLAVIDISIPSSPKIISYFVTYGSAQGVYVSGNYAYVSTVWSDGSSIQVLDISTPSNPVTISFVERLRAGAIYNISDNYAYVAGIYRDDSGEIYGYLEVIDVSNSNFVITRSFITQWSTIYSGFHVSGSYAYLGGKGLQVIDISVPSAPTIIGSFPTYAGGIYVSGSYAYVTAESSSFKVIDISTPSNLKIIGSVDTPGYSYDVYVSGSYAYVADSYEGVQVIDISAPSNPIIIGSVDTPSDPFYGACAIHVSGSYAYVYGYEGVQVIDISAPSNPIIISSVETPGLAWDIYVSGSNAYIMGDNIQVIDISVPSKPAIIGYVNTPSDGGYIYNSGNYTYVYNQLGLHMIKTSILQLLDSGVEDSSTITATIPANLTEGAYNINVINPGGEIDTLHNGFRVGIVDVTPPVINGVEVIDITDTSAVVTWQTDEPSDSVVEFGTTSGEYTVPVSDPTLFTSHSIMLTDLTEETTYYFIVKSADSNDNTAISEEYSFLTETRGPGCFVGTAEDSSVDGTKK